MIVDVSTNTNLDEQETIGNELDTNYAPPLGEAQMGLEANIEGTGDGENVVADPADGLSTLP